MPIIEGRYTMTDTARKLEEDRDRLQRALSDATWELAEADRRVEEANSNTLFWFRLCVVLLIAAGVLAAYAWALAT